MTTSLPRSYGAPTGEAVMSPTYELEIRGEVGPVLRDAFPEFQLRSEHGKTILHGELVDQPALYGVIERVHSLALELVAVRVVTEQSP